MPISRGRARPRSAAPGPPPSSVLAGVGRSAHTESRTIVHIVSKCSPPLGVARRPAAVLGLEPAGERVTVRLRSRSSRRASVVEANVTMDGVTVLNQSWAGHDTVTETA